jgi:peptide/nickel transport system ATP-binding protein
VPDPARRHEKRPVSNDEIASPIRAANYAPPQRQYREVSPGHAVMIWGEEWEAKEPAAAA